MTHRVRPGTVSRPFETVQEGNHAHDVGDAAIDGVPGPIRWRSTAHGRGHSASAAPCAAAPFVFEEFRNDVMIVKHQIGKPGRVGAVLPDYRPAALVESTWECATYYTETIQTAFPFPVELKKKRVQVGYIEKAELKR